MRRSVAGNHDPVLYIHAWRVAYLLRQDHAGHAAEGGWASIEIDINPFPCQIGDVVEPWGECAAIGITGGERWCMFTTGDGSVTLMPADTVRAQMEENPI